MPNQFVWRVHLRQDVLDEATAELRDQPYSVLRSALDRPFTKQVKGRDQKLYDLTLTAGRVSPDSRDLEVTVSLKQGWFGKTLTNRFRVNRPDSEDAPAASAHDARPHGHPIYGDRPSPPAIQHRI